MLNEINNKCPISFPETPKVSSELTELISKMLQIEEGQRISWDELSLRLESLNLEVMPNINYDMQQSIS